MLMSEMLLEEEALDDSSSSDSSIEGMKISFDQDLSLITDLDDEVDDDDNDDDEDSMSIDVIDKVVKETIAYSNYILGPS